MPILSNQRHEIFAQALATGKSASEAYVLAGYRANDGNATRLKGNERVSARLKELRQRSARRVGVTIDTLTDELEAARLKALAAKQIGAAVSASMGKARLHGYLIDKKRLEGPNGGPVQIDLSGFSLEQLHTIEQLLTQIAHSTGEDGEGLEDGGT